MKTKNSYPSSEFESKDKCPSCGSFCNIYTDLDNNDNCNECRIFEDNLETAERLYPTDYGVKSKDIINIIQQEAFIRGAKWEQERSYSEEDLYQLTLESLDLGMRIRQDQLNGYSEKSGKELHKEWFEKFKKKK